MKDVCGEVVEPVNLSEDQQIHCLRQIITYKSIWYHLSSLNLPELNLQALKLGTFRS